MNPVFLVVGPPAVGKSTTSRALAARFPKSVHIPVDNIRDMVISGLVLPNPEWGDDLVQQISLARATASHMALAYHQAGFAVVIDDFWDANHDSDFQPLLSQPDIHRIIVYPSQEEAHRRNLKRAGDSPARAYIDQGIQAVYRTLKPVISELTRDGWLVVDSTTMDADAVVTAILEQTTGRA